MALTVCPNFHEADSQGLTFHLALQLTDNHSHHEALIDTHREEPVLLLSGFTSGTKERHEIAVRSSHYGIHECFVALEKGERENARLPLSNLAVIPN